MTTLKKIKAPYFELGCWLLTLGYLAAINPAATDHFELCVFKWLGLTFCPGCGLGHSISWLLHGNLSRSWEQHPLGVLALAVLIHRMYTLLKNNFNPFKHPRHEHRS